MVLSFLQDLLDPGSPHSHDSESDTPDTPESDDTFHSPPSEDISDTHENHYLCMGKQAFESFETREKLAGIQMSQRRICDESEKRNCHRIKKVDRKSSEARRF